MNVVAHDADREIERSSVTRPMIGRPDEWDILYRLRLQMERDILTGAEPGTEFPTDPALERVGATSGGPLPARVAPVAPVRLSVGPEAR